MSTSVRRTLGTLALIVAVLPHLGASDDLSSPVGAWKTIDDKTGKALSIVRVYEQDGQVFARVERILTPGEETRTCTRCTDDRKDQPVVGLVFMRHMQLVDGIYRNGDILDPENGTVYRCRMQLEDGGRKLRVRGFVGMSWFGRSQVWQREP
ncbi:MAG: DUF2147 domain-containing protein [Acidobacteriota bacterium]